MAGRSFVQLLGALDPGVVVLPISWDCNGASNPVATSILGRGVASVVLSATGVYTVTLQDVYSGLLAANATLQLATSDDKVTSQIGVVSLSASTFQVRIFDISTGALANVAAATGNRVNLLLVLKNSSV
jgi:hypothetical protein